MRFIGNKEKLLLKIHQAIVDEKIKGESFFDLFAGSTSVSKFFKKLDMKISSCDLMFFSYILQRAYIVNNKQCAFIKLIKKLKIKSNDLFSTPLLNVVDYLNNIKPVLGFIFQNYTPGGTSSMNQPRMYFSEDNGSRIDAIRTEIEIWNVEGLITEDEYYVLLACLIESVSFYSNISGVYGAFNKKWDPRALKRFNLRPITLIEGQKNNVSYNDNCLNLLHEIKADIFYLDPPYNQRQYAPNYHILETIGKYDSPIISGVAGLRNYKNQKSNFCNKKTALEDLEKVCEKGLFKYLILSYNTEGIMSKNDIVTVLSNYGNVVLKEFDYPRFKSNNKNINSSRHIKEQLYILKNEKKSLDSDRRKA